MIQVIATGGTIDKVYFDALSEFTIGESQVPEVFGEANVSFEYQVMALIGKDSLEMTDEDREVIKAHIVAFPGDKVLITHGTDAMAHTGSYLMDIPNKTIVLTGAMQPLRFRRTDAIFNIGFAVGALQTLPHGVYIAMNGQIFNPRQVVKNRSAKRFEYSAEC